VRVHKSLLGGKFWLWNGRMHIGWRRYTYSSFDPRSCRLSSDGSLRNFCYDRFSVYSIGDDFSNSGDASSCFVFFCTHQSTPFFAIGRDGISCFFFNKSR